MRTSHPIRSALRDDELLKLHLAFHSLLVRAFPDRSIEILAWRTLLALRKNPFIQKKAPPCARIAWKNPTRKKREEWCPDFKNPRIQFFALSEFVRSLIGATCGRDEPMRILKETIFMDVDPWPVFLYLARDRGGVEFSIKPPKKQTGRPRGSKNKKPCEAVPLFSPEKEIKRAA